MAVFPIVYQGVQLGAEVTSTPGVAIAADKQLLSLGMSRLMPKSEGGFIFRGQGNQLGSAIVPPGKRWSEVSFESILSYNTDIYLLSGIISDAPAADGTNGQLWEFAPTLASADVRQTYTIMVGNAVRAQSASYCQLASLNISWNKGEAKASGTFLARKASDDIVITPTPTLISPVIANPQSFIVKTAATQAGLTGASEHALPLAVTFDLPQFLQPLFRMSSTDTSFHTLVPQAMEPTLSFKTGFDDADYGTLFTSVGTSTPTWFRIESTGAVIAGAVASAYKWRLDFCGASIEDPTPDEEAGAATNTFPFKGVYDAVAGFMFKFSLTNTATAL